MRARMTIAALAVVTGAAMAGGAAASAAPVGSREAASCGAWRGAGLPSSGTLTSVVAFSACDVWAAGYQGTHSLVVHWNGRGWTVARGGVVSWDGAWLPVAIGGTSDRDVWLATATESRYAKATVEHWNGTRFSRVSLPLPAGAVASMLYGVSAVSRTDAWAVGWYLYDTPAGVLGPAANTATLVEHWNGRAWSVVPSADPSTPLSGSPGIDNVLYGVSAQRGEAWAAGNYFNAADDGQSTLLEQWNGHAWVWVKSPDAARFNQLNAVSADSPFDAWAVGYKNGLPDQALVEHWNGMAWHVMAFPDPGRDGQDRPSSVLTGVSALSPRDVWVCGFYPVKGGQVRTLLAHWNGATWQQVVTPASVKIFNALNAVSAPGPGDIWSVGGTTTIKGVQQPMALHHG